jgi:hypothetical protein
MDSKVNIEMLCEVLSFSVTTHIFSVNLSAYSTNLFSDNISYLAQPAKLSKNTARNAKLFPPINPFSVYCKNRALQIKCGKPIDLKSNVPLKHCRIVANLPDYQSSQ